MANKRGKAIDNTHLSVEQATKRGFVHRDYLAHCLRWNHILKFLREKNRYKNAFVLDVGCGKELPLAKSLHTSRMAPAQYLGIEYNNNIPGLKHFANTSFKPHIISSANFTEVVSIDKDHLCITYGDGEVERLGSLPTCIVSFEVIEHVEPFHAKQMLKLMHDIAALNNADVFISTPNWDPGVGAADNHVNEMKYGAIGWLLEQVGFEIINVYGTFASQKDIKTKLHKHHLELFEQLRGYYDSNYLATIFAPLYPGFSRNALWHCQPRINGERKFPDIRDLDTPWTSSEYWKDLLNDLDI